MRGGLFDGVESLAAGFASLCPPYGTAMSIRLFVGS